MALRDAWLVEMDADIEREVTSDEAAPSLCANILPANGPGDWTGGYIVRLETKRRGDTAITWVSSVVPATEKPDTDAVTAEIKAVHKRIEERRTARMRGGDGR